MILQTLTNVSTEAFLEHTGWASTAQGLCRGEVCVPAPGSLRPDDTVDVEVAAARLGMPMLRDNEHDLWAVGSATLGGKALSSAAAADPELITRDGNPFRLSSLHGRKVLLVAWSSY